MLRPLIGVKLDGATLAEVDDRGGIGAPAWGPVALLRDLELRLGLQVVEAPDVLRVHQWSTRLAALLGNEPFYARSYRVDALGTAEMLLAWRDELIDAGWDGSDVPGGGARLDAFAALEALAERPLLPGPADRLAAVEAELALRDESAYAELVFADDRSIWPHRWGRVFQALAERGTTLRDREVAAPREPATSDLGRLQALIREGRTAAEPVLVRGDGSLVLLRAPTTFQAADAVGALIAASSATGVAVIRSAQVALLDDALQTHGLAPLGTRASSRWRPALQLLPLALEMVFAPVDPRRALELLGLPVSPFAYVTRYMMSRALTDAPGIGDVRWRNAKQRLRDRLASSGEPEDEQRADRQVELVETWLEPRRYPSDGAPRATLIEVTTRVRDWLRLRLADGGPVDAIAVEQCRQLALILESEPRETLDLLTVRRLLDAVTAAGAGASLKTEGAGRCDHVDHPGALLLPRDLVIWWHFAAETAPPPHRTRWRRLELDALAAGDVLPLDPRLLLAEEARQWRAAVLAADRQLVFVLPSTNAGERTSPHPLWDEIVARLRLDDAQIGRLTMTVDDLASRRGWAVAVEELPPLSLPTARPSWQLPRGAVAPPEHLSPASLQELLECPLRWTLGHAAKLRTNAVPTVPEGALLNGILGHRLIQVLVEAGLVAAAPTEIERVIDELLPGVAASLLQPGLASELQQLRHQLVRAVGSLADLLRRGDLTITATEEEVAVTWLDTPLVGRLDLRLQDRAGRDLILDLKWGHTTHRDHLREGRAVQLASYAHARQLQTGAAALPAAGYFSISRGRLLTTGAAAFGHTDGTAGPSLEETRSRIALTAPVVQRALAAGHIPVTGVSRSLPLLDALGVHSSEQPRHYVSGPGDGCAYCAFGALCGKAWEARP